MVDVRLILEGIGILDGSDNISDSSLTNAVKDPSTSSSITPGFDSWTQSSATRPAFIELDIRVETDGTTQGQVDIDVDESGGTSADYSFTATAEPTLAAGEGDDEYFYVYLPAGAQFQINNVADPQTGNAINVAREIIA